MRYSGRKIPRISGEIRDNIGRHHTERPVWGVIFGTIRMRSGNTTREDRLSAGYAAVRRRLVCEARSAFVRIRRLPAVLPETAEKEECGVGADYADRDGCVCPGEWKETEAQARLMTEPRETRMSAVSGRIGRMDKLSQRGIRLRIRISGKIRFSRLTLEEWPAGNVILSAGQGSMIFTVKEPEEGMTLDDYMCQRNVFSRMRDFCR